MGHKFIVANAQAIEEALGKLQTSRDGVQTQKDKLDTLNSELVMQSQAAFEGKTAEKYQKIHADLAQTATKMGTLMETVIQCIRYYLTSQVTTDESDASQMNIGS